MKRRPPPKKPTGYVPRLPEYEHIDFDDEAVIDFNRRLRGYPMVRISVELERSTIDELKAQAALRETDYRTLLRRYVLKALIIGKKDPWFGRFGVRLLRRRVIKRAKRSC